MPGMCLADRESYPEKIPASLTTAAILLGGDLMFPALSKLVETRDSVSIIEVLRDSHGDADKTALVDTILETDARAGWTVLNYSPLVQDVWNAARSVLPTNTWMTRWRVEHRLRARIAEEFTLTAFRKSALYGIRHDSLTKEGAVRTLRNDTPNGEETARAVREIVTLPTKIIIQLLKETVRPHPSIGLRSAIVEKIASQQFSTEVYEAAAMIDSTWSYLAFEKLVVTGSWTEVKNVLYGSDASYRQDLVQALWKAHKKGKLVPKHVAKMALQTLPPLALIWKSRMKKLAGK